MSKAHKTIYMESVRRLADMSAKLSVLAEAWHGVNDLNEHELLELVKKIEEIEAAIKRRYTYHEALIFRKVKVASGRVIDVEFLAVGRNFFSAKADGLPNIIIKKSSSGWTAVCYGAYHKKDDLNYHHSDAAEAFALAANDVWK